MSSYSKHLLPITHIVDAFCLLLCGLPARAQFRGGIEVTVTDASGAPVPGRMRLGEAARLDLRANFFNAFNQLNLTPFGLGSRSTRIEDALFGQPLSGLAGRVIEFQARLSF